MSVTWDAVTLDERRAIIGRFNDRVDAAEEAAAPTKTWARAAVKGPAHPAARSACGA